MSINAQVTIFEEDFGNNPFTGNTSTGLTFWDGTDCDEAYAIQHNFNDLCQFFPNVGALTPAGSADCMNVNMPGNNNNREHIYINSDEMICAGNYQLTIVAVHRYNGDSGFQDNVDFELTIAGQTVAATSLPYGNAGWTTLTANFTLDTDETGFNLDLMNSGLNSDFAIDYFSIDLICPVGAIVGGVPSCSDAGDQFTVEVWVNTPIGPNTIEEIYTEGTNYDYVSHTSAPLWIDGWSQLFITFETNACSCTGDMLVFDIRIKNCPTVIWLMTRNIPCCESDCSGITVEDYELDNDCYIVNGNKAFDFSASIWLDSGVEVLGVTAEGIDGGLCPSNVTDLSFNVSGGSLQIGGIIEVENPDCEYADIVLQIDTKFGCCEILLQFSMPDPCDEDCLDNAVTMDNVITGVGPVGQTTNNHLVTISMPYPVGTTFTITNNQTGVTTTETVGNAICAPFSQDKWGNHQGTPCTGFVFHQNFDCSHDADKEEDTSYSFTIQIGECRYLLIGDYCDILNGDPVFPDDGPNTPTGGGGFGLREADNLNQTFEAEVFPNPASSYETLSIRTNSIIKQVQIFDTSGKMLINQLLTDPANEYQLDQLDLLDSGMYFIKILSTNNDQVIKKVTVIE